MTFVKDIPIERITKDKLIGCVRAYCELFPNEYDLAIEHIKAKRWLLDDMEFGQTKTNGIVTRALFEIPENLDAIIIKGLSTDEIVQFRGLRGSRWFAKQFPQFRTPKEV